MDCRVGDTGFLDGVNANEPVTRAAFLLREHASWGANFGRLNPLRAMPRQRPADSGEPVHLASCVGSSPWGGAVLCKNTTPRLTGNCSVTSKCFAEASARAFERSRAVFDIHDQGPDQLVPIGRASPIAYGLD